MQFLIKQSAFVDDRYIDARSGPTVLELKDDISLDNVSLTWDPLDEKAQAAQKALAQQRKERRERAKADAEAAIEVKPIAKLPVKPGKVDPATLREVQKRGAPTGNADVI